MSARRVPEAWHWDVLPTTSMLGELSSTSAGVEREHLFPAEPPLAKAKQVQTPAVEGTRRRTPERRGAKREK